ncbi:MAG: ATP-binding protein [Ferruginibacter sp.]
MKIKAKLTLGIGLLFAMIVLLTVLGGLYINKLSGDTKNILVSNYNTIDYSRKMLNALNNSNADSGQLKAVQDNLLKQQQNITELGEAELTGQLTTHFEQLKKTPGSPDIIKTVRNDISDIMLLNMLAIQRKSAKAEDTAGKAIFWIGLTGSICFLIAFVLLINLPGNIANPVKELTNSIKEIASENYSERVHFEKKNEFGELAAAFNIMAEKLEEYQTGNLEKLMMEKKRIETLINNMNDPVIGLDDNNRVIFMNGVAKNVAGLNDTNVIGKRIEDIAIKNDLIRKLIQNMDNSDNNADLKSTPIKIYADKKESYFEKEIIPIKIIPTGEAAEKLIGNVILLQNITPYKELEFAKTNFIAVVSHELKTPIASIKMSLELLGNKQTGNLNTEQQDLLESIDDDASRLLKITAELLNMTQVESGALQLNIVAADPEEIIGYAVNANKAAAEEKQIRIETNVQPDIKNVLADTEKTSWILTNLISNAIRYSYENAVVILKVSNEDERIVFSVSDTGQGIQEQYLDKIFDRYFRIPGTKKAGTGLGLSISKEFIEAQKGNITVSSEFGSGSTFTISLPAVPQKK